MWVADPIDGGAAELHLRRIVLSVVAPPSLPSLPSLRFVVTLCPSAAEEGGTDGLSNLQSHCSCL